MSGEERIDRLEARLARERRAREEAEAIAERGMRDLWLANRDLEARVEERTAELARSLRAVTMAAEAKETFLAELGHELATPLHAVLGMIELIDDAALAADDRERLAQVHEHAAALSELLAGLVELAAATGSTDPDDIEARDPTEWLDELTERWMRTAAGRGQLLVPASDGSATPVRLDWGRLRKMADNVVESVVRHAGPGSINITLVVSPETVTLSVRDSGPGMSADQLATAAEPFVRRDESGSMEIGLAVTRRLAESVGGSIDVTSDGRTRTETSVSLPRPDR